MASCPLLDTDQYFHPLQHSTHPMHLLLKPLEVRDPACPEDCPGPPSKFIGHMYIFSLNSIQTIPVTSRSSMPAGHECPYTRIIPGRNHIHHIASFVLEVWSNISQDGKSGIKTTIGLIWTTKEFIKCLLVVWASIPCGVCHKSKSRLDLLLPMPVLIEQAVGDQGGGWWFVVQRRVGIL